MGNFLKACISSNQKKHKGNKKGVTKTHGNVENFRQTYTYHLANVISPWQEKNPCVILFPVRQDERKQNYP